MGEGYERFEYIYIKHSPEGRVQFVTQFAFVFRVKKLFSEDASYYTYFGRIFAQKHLPVVKRNFNTAWTQHLWLRLESKEKTYQFFRLLEDLHILTNYRLLPYGIGYGLRLGTAAAVRQGLDEKNVPALAEIISKAYYANVIDEPLRKAASTTIATIKKE